MIKNNRIKLTENFYLDEFICKDAQGSFAHKKNDKFVKNVLKLQTVRSRLGMGLKVNSAFRTWAHHKAVYEKLGKKPPRGSMHLKNEAFDVTYFNGRYRTKRNLERLARELRDAGFKVVVINYRLKFVHVDSGRARTWSYQGRS